MDKLLKFKNALVNELEEQGFPAVSSVLDKIRESHCTYDKVALANLRNDGVQPLGPLLANDYVNRIKIFISSLSGDVGYEVNTRYRVPLRPNFFLGREDLIVKIHDRLSGKIQHEPVLLLSAIGGMGKTTLMQEYLHRAVCQEHFTSIAVITVNKNLRSAFTWGAAAALGLNESMKTIVNPDKQLEYVLQEMSQTGGNNLFVLDNINESDIDDLREMKNYFDRSGWKFLVTTRTAPEGFKKIVVDELLEEEALLLFAYHYAPDEVAFDNKQEKIEAYINESGIRKGAIALLKHILRHTLLTELLAKTARLKGYEPRQVLQMLKDQDLKHPGLERTIHTGKHAATTHREELTATTVHLYINHLFDTEYLIKETGDTRKDAKNKAVATMLRFFSILPPDDIPIEDLKRLWQVKEEEVNKFEDNLDETKQIGWIQGKHAKLKIKGLTQNLVYKMHPLIQEVVYEKLQPDIDNCRPLVRTITQVLSGTLQHPQRFQKYAQAVIDNLDMLHTKN